MYNIEKANRIYKEKMLEDSRFAEKIIDDFREKMPEIFAKTMFEKEFGCHIVDKDMYEEAVSLLKWSDDRGYGAKWTVEEIQNSGINFEKTDYYPLDFAYVVNMLYSDYGHIFTDPNYYFKMAVAYLEDPDYFGKADERAYKNAIKRIEYNAKKLSPNS